MGDQPPLWTWAPSLSTLSPRLSRINEYKKQVGAVMLFMPVWDLNELMAIAQLEGRNLDGTTRNFGYFGGIICYTLGDSIVVHDAENELEGRCRSARTEVFRSINADIDDSANAVQQYNISGFLVCYANIPRAGAESFARQSLVFPSQYARTKILEKFYLEEPEERLIALASHLAKG